jgi:hypothetical protein
MAHDGAALLPPLLPPFLLPKDRGSIDRRSDMSTISKNHRSIRDNKGKASQNKDDALYDAIDHGIISLLNTYMYLQRPYRHVCTLSKITLLCYYVIVQNEQPHEA